MQKELEMKMKEARKALAAAHKLIEPMAFYFVYSKNSIFLLFWGLSPRYCKHFKCFGL